MIATGHPADGFVPDGSTTSNAMVPIVAPGRSRCVSVPAVWIPLGKTNERKTRRCDRGARRSSPITGALWGDTRRPRRDRDGVCGLRDYERVACAFEDGSLWSLKVAVTWDPLRSDPRFDRLLHRSFLRQLNGRSPRMKRYWAAQLEADKPQQITTLSRPGGVETLS